MQLHLKNQKTKYFMYNDKLTKQKQTKNKTKTKNKATAATTRTTTKLKFTDFR